MLEFNYNKARWELANTLVRLPDESRTAFEKRVHKTAWELGREHYARQREQASLTTAYAQPETYREAYEREYEASYQADRRPVHYCNSQVRLNRAKERYTR